MGTVTTLSGINLTATESSAGAAFGEDMTGTLQCAMTKAQELVAMLATVANRLPSGDANIAIINNVITNLS